MRGADLPQRGSWTGSEALTDVLNKTNWIDRVEAEEASFVPPYPHRRRVPANVLELARLYRQSMISVFARADYRRDLIANRFGLLDIVTLNSPELVKEALQNKHEVLQAKTPQMRHALKPLLGDGLFVSDRSLWAERRAAIGPIIHASRVRSFAPIMLDVLEEWRTSWERQGDGAEIDMLSEMAQLTAEIISRTVFGRKLGRDFTAEIVRGFTQYQVHVDQLDLLSLLRMPNWIPRRQSRSAKRALKRVHAVIDDVIEEFAQGRGDRNAVIASLFEARDDEGNPLTRTAIRNEAIVIFMAGHETTANTLAWAWFMISKSGRVRRKFHAEIDALGRFPRFEDVRSLTVTRSIVEETLRLYPPVPILGRQALADVEIGGHWIKKDSVVMVCPFLLHRKAALYPKPDHFIPERFDARVAPRPEKYAYVPFAIGPRICPGLTFGLTEAVLSLAVLGQRFDPCLKDNHDVVPHCRLTLRPGESLPMVLRDR